MSTTVVPKRILPIIPLALAIGSLVLPAAAFAQPRHSQVTADATVAASERQAVMGISRLGLESTSFRFPVFYTPHGGSTLPIGSWSVNINQQYADATLAENISFIIPSRFDRLIFEGNKATLETATQIFDAMDIGQVIPQISSTTMSYSNYQKTLLDHLNLHIAPVMQEVMGAAAEARYGEMNAQERGTFITERARQTGMPAEVLEGLISSGYAFGFYLPRLQGHLSISQIERTRFDGSTYYVYRTSLQAPLKTRLMVFHFDGEQFTTQIELDAVADGLFEGLAQRMSGSAGVTTRWLPRERHAQQIFDDVFQYSFKDSTIALSTRLKEYREFAVATPVVDPTPDNIILEVGNQEDIRVDQPFTFNRNIDGKEQQIGWGRVRTTGKTCLILPEGERKSSQAHLIQGQVDEFDLAIEHPWTGVYGRVGAAYSMTELEVDGNDTGAANATFFELGFTGNLGYLTNQAFLSEVWTNLDLGIGMTSDGEGDYEAIKGNSAIRFKFGAEKRFHLAQGLYAAAGADFGFERHFFTAPRTSTNTEEDFKVSTINLIPRAELGYYFTPNLKIYGGAAYNLPLNTDYEWDDGATLTNDLEMKAGLSAHAGIAFHIGFAGPFASLMSKPSSECQELRDARLEALAAEAATDINDDKN